MKVALLVGWLMVNMVVSAYYEFGYDNAVAGEETGSVRAMDDTFPPPPPPPDWP
jgi:hypothetical protein